MESEPQPEPADDQAEPSTSFRLAEYRRLPLARLREAAAVAGLEETAELERRALVLALPVHCAGADAIGLGDGILELHPDGFGFLRSIEDDCRPGADDIYVGRNQIQRLRLCPGQRIEGLIRTPRPGERYFAMLRVQSVDGQPLDPGRRRIPFRYLPPVLPHRALPLRHAASSAAAKVIDAVAPLAAGQRVLLHIPPEVRGAEVLADLGQDLTANHPDTRILVLSLAQSPDEQSHLCDRLAPHTGIELFRSTFDEPALHHTGLAKLVLARAQHLVEDGHDTVLLLDSLNTLVHASNLTVAHSGKILSAGLDADAVQLAKTLWCSARQTDGGASLTVVATLRRDPASLQCTAIAEEFRDQANATITYDAELAELGLHPAILCRASHSRWTGNYLDAVARQAIGERRLAQRGMSDQAALRSILAATAAESE